MSEARRERLLDIQKREQLKGLLINKFKLKYGNKPNVSANIDNEVNKFLKNDRLTEENLRRLDEKIAKESALRDKKEAIIDERMSEKKAPNGAKGSSGKSDSIKNENDSKSVVTSVTTMSSASRPLSQMPSKSSSIPKSVTSSQKPKTEVYSELDEDDEWDAIIKFNTLLHYEE